MIRTTSMSHVASPIVAILMPVYNAERYLNESIESIRNQTLPNFEFVIVNDGSTDQSLDIIKHHAAEDDRIRVLDRPNQGIVSALNAGLYMSRSKYIARMDADDVSERERLAVQTSYLNTNGAVGIVGSKATGLDAEGRTVPIREVSCEAEEIERRFLAGSCEVIHPTIMFRRNLIVRLGGYRHECCFAEDLDLCLRVLCHAKIVNLPEPLLRYREHLASTSSVRAVDQVHAAVRALDDAYRCRGVAMPRQLRAQLLRRVSWTSGDAGMRREAFVHAAKHFLMRPFAPDSAWLVLRSCLPRSVRFRRHRPHALRES